MSYDKFTCSYFDNLPSLKRLQFDFDYLQDFKPDFLYHYSFGLYCLVVVRNYDSKGNRSSYSLKSLGYPPSFGSWKSLFTSSILEDVLSRFRLEILKHLQSVTSTRGDWFVSEL